MTRWTIYDEIRQDAAALDRLKDELLALSRTDLDEAQLAQLMRMALILQALRNRTRTRARQTKSKAAERT